MVAAIWTMIDEDAVERAARSADAFARAERGPVLAEFPYLAEASANDDADAAEPGGNGLRTLLDGLAMPFAAVRALDGMGVPRMLLGQLTAAGDIAVADVDLGRDGGRFAFGGPTRRLILAVRVDGVLIDLAALSSTCEDEWALHLGMADFLGEELLDRARTCEWRELRLFGTPLAWLRAGGRGVCVLDWTPAALAALRGLGPGVTLVCDAGAKPKLEALLRHGGLPLVAEDRPVIGRAA